MSHSTTAEGLVAGFATPQSTKPSPHSLGRVFETRRRELYPQGPLVTPVGFGAYRVGYGRSHRHPECAQALRQSLEQGLNLIDTSANYGFGQSEELIGKTLRQAFADGIVQREQIVLVSKVGYMQGPNLDIAKVREREGRPFPEISQFGEDTWHCIHPDFIHDQVERSRQRLGLETLDVYLLHNPEYMLKRFEIDGMEKEAARELFYSRIGKSFQALEELVAQGKIHSYGVSSNQLGVPDEEYASVSIAGLLRIAQRLGPQHHFRVVQMPLNWLEIAPVFYELENEKGHSTLSFAQKNGLGVLVNRPFNAMNQDGLIRLTRPPFPIEDLPEGEPGLRAGYENWHKLASDLERMAHDQLTDAPGYQEAPLSQLVLCSLLWLPGVSAVLCGMRTPAYVEDAQQALAKPALPHAKMYLKSIYENLEFHADAHEGSH